MARKMPMLETMRLNKAKVIRTATRRMRVLLELW